MVIIMYDINLLSTIAILGNTGNSVYLLLYPIVNISYYMGNYGIQYKWSENTGNLGFC